MNDANSDAQLEINSHANDFKQRYQAEEIQVGNYNLKMINKIAQSLQ